MVMVCLLHKIVHNVCLVLCSDQSAVRWRKRTSLHVTRLYSAGHRMARNSYESSLGMYTCNTFQMFWRKKTVSDSVSLFTSESKIPRSKLDSQIVLKPDHAILVICMRFKLSITVTATLSTYTYGPSGGNPSVVRIPWSSTPPPPPRPVVRLAVSSWPYAVMGLLSSSSTVICSDSPSFQILMFCNGLAVLSTYL